MIPAIRKRCRYVVLTGVISIHCLTAIATAEPLHLLSDDLGLSRQAQIGIVEQRSNTISELIAIIDTPINTSRVESVKRAIYCLGELRAEQAVGTLLNHLNFPYDILSYGEVVTLDGWHAPTETSKIAEVYPAVHALITIGDACVPSVLSKYTQTSDPWERRICARIICNLYTRTERVGILQQAAESEQEPSRKKLLESFAHQEALILHLQDAVAVETEPARIKALRAVIETYAPAELEDL